MCAVLHPAALRLAMCRAVAAVAVRAVQVPIRHVRRRAVHAALVALTLRVAVHVVQAVRSAVVAAAAVAPVVAVADVRAVDADDAVNKEKQSNVL